MSIQITQTILETENTIIISKGNHLYIYAFNPVIALKELQEYSLDFSIFVRYIEGEVRLFFSDSNCPQIVSLFYFLKNTLEDIASKENKQITILPS